MKSISEYVETNLGKIPIEDYLEIKASQYGFDSYEDLYYAGFRIDGYENICPDMHGQKENRNQSRTGISR